MANLILTIVFLFFGCASTTNLDHAKPRSNTQIFNLQDACNAEGYKKEIHLKNGMAVFTFNETEPRSRNRLAGNGFSCHLELETYPEHGFHVYIDEMHLDELMDDSTPIGCKDSLQFGRDVLFVTNFQSKKFCGNVAKGNSANVETPAKRPRLYIEENDREMDIWLTIKSASDDGDFQPRFLTLVVTVFKKGCGSKDNAFRACPLTQKCIRKEYFCDGYVNCAWPSGEVATDEGPDCGDLSNGGDSSGSAIFSASNIPVIIIVVIVVLALVVIFFIACNRFVGLVKKQPVVDEDRGLTVPLGPNTEAGPRSETALRTMTVEGEDPSVHWPPMPPSYDEVIKSSGMQPPISRLPSEPPAYSPTAPTVTTTTDL